MHYNDGKIKAARPVSTKQKKLTWFRFYGDAIDDPKVQRLAPNLFKTWVNLLCIASQSGGILPSIDDLSFRLRMSVQDTEQQISDLILAGLIDITPAGRSPHNWNNRQFQSDSSTERVRKHRKIKDETPCNVSETVVETAPDTETDTDTEAESEQTESPLPPLGEIDDPKPNVQPISDWKTAFAPQDEHEGIAIDCGRVTLVNGTRQFWEIQFDGDTGALDLAIIEANSDLNTGSRKPIKVQIERVLARIARERKDRSRNYAKAVERNAANKPGPAPGKKSALTIIAEMEASGAFAN